MMEFRSEFVGLVVLAVLFSGCVDVYQEEIATTTTAQVTVPENYPQVIKVGRVPSKGALVEWEEFKEKYGDFHSMRWNSYTGSPERLSKFVKITDLNVSTAEIAKQVVMNFLNENKELLNVNIEDLEIKRLEESTDGKKWGVDYMQVYNQVPVYRGFVMMSILRDGKMQTLTNQFYPNISIPTTPRLTKEEAEDIALDFVNISREQAYGIDTTLYIYPKKGGSELSYHLAWMVKINMCKDIFVDAYLGTIVHEYYNNPGLERCRYRRDR